MAKKTKAKTKAEPDDAPEFDTAAIVRDLRDFLLDRLSDQDARPWYLRGEIEQAQEISRLTLH